MDVRRELDLVNKHFRRHHDVAGDTVVWYEFIPLGASASAYSVYDDVYDEGARAEPGRSYRPGIVIPTLLASENEDQRRAIPEGRQPVQTMNLFVSLRDMREAGVENPHEYRQHLNDMFLYDGRYYTVYDYRVRGRLRDEVFILIQGQEVYIDQEMVNDPGPSSLGVVNLPWPTELPSLS
jgi:hypothetical protein